MNLEGYSDAVMDHFMCPRNRGVINNSNGWGLLNYIYKSRKQ